MIIYLLIENCSSFFKNTHSGFMLFVNSKLDIEPLNTSLISPVSLVAFFTMVATDGANSSKDNFALLAFIIFKEIISN